MKFQARDLNDFRELVSRGLRRAAASFSDLLNVEVELQIPGVRTYVLHGLVMPLIQQAEENFTLIELDFLGPYPGKAALIFPSSTVENLTRVFLRSAGQRYDLEAAINGTVHEMGNVLLNGVLDEITGYISAPMRFALPQIFEGKSEKLLEVLLRDAEAVLLAQTHFLVPDYNIREEVLLLIEIRAFGEFMEKVRMQTNE